MKTYTIGGTEYEQKKLVLGQALDLIKAIKDIRFPEGFKDFSVLQMIDFFGERVFKLIAIVLLEKGKDRAEYLKTRDLESLAEKLRYEFEIDLAIEVASDFFTLNQTSSLLKKVTEALRQVRGTIPG